jgi:esterase/lipase
MKRNNIAPESGWLLKGIFTLLLCSLPFILLKKEFSTNMISHRAPAMNYDEALLLFESLRSHEPPGMNPLCVNQLLTHGFRAERAIILVHGYTSAPPQFRELGRKFFEAGFNVLIAALPHHGLSDRMTERHGRLTATELAAYADRTVDIATGLGSHVTMLGLSAGGVTTAWAAQQRKELDCCIIISPAFGFRKIPTLLTWPAMVFYRLLPDAFEWWEPELKENGASSYGYPKYSHHALTEVLRLGFVVKDEARNSPPTSKKIIMVLNPNDDMVNNEMAEQLAELWKARGANISTFRFDAGLKLPHDLVGADQSAQRIDIVYPKLVELAGT